MKPKVLTWCAVLAAIVATVFIIATRKEKPSTAPQAVESPRSAALSNAPQETPSPQALPESDVTLHEGDPAPKLTVSKWIQGEPVKEFEPGTAYLMVFFASWYTPSKEAMPYVSHLHQKYKDKGLVVIGQDVKETPDTDIEPFVKRMGSLMPFRVALDEGTTNRWTGKMQQNWLQAAEAGLPAAFLIDKKGIICFIGHPEEIEDELIDQVLAGTFDPKKRALDRAENKTKAKAYEIHNELGRKAWRTNQWDKALAEIEQMEKLVPRKRAATQCLRMTVLLRKEDYDAANKVALELSKDDPNDPFLQHRIARTIALQMRSKFVMTGAERDLIIAGGTNNIVLNTANQLMDRAVGLLNGPEPEFLHTQARLAFLQGKREKAIELETEALSLAAPGIKDQFADALENFKQGRLPQ